MSNCYRQAKLHNLIILSNLLLSLSLIVVGKG
jgi:hypothetical protein